MERLFNSDDKEKSLGSQIGTIIGTILAPFFSTWMIQLAYTWVSWNFNLPAIDSYWTIFALWMSFRYICVALGKIFHK